MVKKNRRELLINQVEGFNPLDYLETATDSDGRPWITDAGEEIKFLPADVKNTWFWAKHPNGAVYVSRVPNNEGTIRYHAEVWFDINAPRHNAEADYELLVPAALSSDGYGRLSSKCQTLAVSKALEKAGFGCEINMIYRQFDEEPAEKSTEKATKKAEKASEKKEKKQEKVPEKAPEAEPNTAAPVSSEADPDVSDDDFINGLLDDANEEKVVQTESEPVPEPEPEPEPVLAEPETVPEPAKSPSGMSMTDALNTVITLTDKAKFGMLKFADMTIKEALDDMPDFCAVIVRETVRDQVTPETLEAARTVLRAQAGK